VASPLHIAKHPAGGLVDRLVYPRLLVRKKGASDARTVLLAVTARGRKVLEQLTAAHRDEIARLGPAMQIPEFLYE
jgi:DNA-binding MarR family transcriptional regulator